MIILPDRTEARALFLKPVLAREWRDAPGQTTRFSVEARRRGALIWTGWFDDREDFDEFCWAAATGNIRYDRYIQRLPVPCIDPSLFDDEDVQYAFLTTSFITSGTTWSVPADCRGISGQAGEFIDCIGGGGSGPAVSRLSSTDIGVGGGGGAWGRITSLSLTPSGSVTVQVGAGGAGRSPTGGGNLIGNPGTGTWFNGTTLTSCSVSADFGRGGTLGATGPLTATAGGLAANGTGTSKNNGGNSGSVASSLASGLSGSGGAGGPNGAGVAGTNCTVAGTSTAGGAGDAGSGGAGSAGSTTANTSNGGNGTEYDATHGSGGGSGSCLRTAAGDTGLSGDGGNYGGGTGCAYTTSNTGGLSVSGNAGPGLIVVRYAPVSGYMLNMPMMGI